MNQPEIRMQQAVFIQIDAAAAATTCMSGSQP